MLRDVGGGRYGRHTKSPVVPLVGVPYFYTLETYGWKTFHMGSRDPFSSFDASPAETLYHCWSHLHKERQIHSERWIVVFFRIGWASILFFNHIGLHRSLYNSSCCHTNLDTLSQTWPWSDNWCNLKLQSLHGPHKSILLALLLESIMRYTVLGRTCLSGVPNWAGSQPTYFGAG